MSALTQLVLFGALLLGVGIGGLSIARRLDRRDERRQGRNRSR
jgi:hypothetical protein